MSGDGDDLGDLQRALRARLRGDGASPSVVLAADELRRMLDELGRLRQANDRLRRQNRRLRLRLQRRGEAPGGAGGAGDVDPGSGAAGPDGGGDTG